MGTHELAGTYGNSWELRWPPRRLLAALIVFTLILDAWIIFRYPVIYWEDSYTRFAMRGEILLGRWLPPTQIIIFLAAKLTPALALPRLVLSGFAAGAVASIYVYTRDIFDEATGLAAAALLATQVMFIALSTVPYVEVLFILLLFLILYFFEHREKPGHRVIAYTLIGLACLTRYDAWLFVPLFVLEEFLAGKPPSRPPACGGMPFSPRKRGELEGGSLWHGLVKGGIALLTLAAIPVGWYFFGTYDTLAHETDSLGRILRGDVAVLLINYARHALWQIRPDVMLFALIGFWLALKSPGARRQPLRVLILIAIQLAMLGIVGPWQPENLRLTFMAGVLILPYAAHGLVTFARKCLALVERGRGDPAPTGGLKSLAIVEGRLQPLLARGALALLAVLAFAALTGFGLRFVAGAAAINRYQLPYLAGPVFERLPHQNILLLTEHPVSPYAFATYTGLPLSTLYEPSPSTLSGVEGQTALTDLSAQSLQEHHISHIVALYADPAELSDLERGLLALLESGGLPARRTTIQGVTIWETGAQP